MYEVLWDVISSGDFQLEDIVNKINTLWVEGQINNDQREDLLQQVEEHLDPEKERPDDTTILSGIAERVTALEQWRAQMESGDAPGPGTQYPEWQPWDGVSKDYQKGAIVTHNGQLWESIYEGQNVWEPGTTGTERLWAKYTPEMED